MPTNASTTSSPAAVGKLTRNELLKASDPTLAGEVARTLADVTAARFSDDDEQFLKFHGIYQGDDRDKRKTGKEYIFMVRGRIPGGIVPAEQYLAFDDLASRLGNNTLRITTRQSFQWHGVAKQGLGSLIRGIHQAMSTTIAACGDVVRNVMAPPTPAAGPLAQRVRAEAAVLSAALAPQKTAYHQIWVDGVELDLPADGSKTGPDPLYGSTYLPRKFKIAFAVPPLNDTDVFSNCLGFVAVPDPNDPDGLLGFNLLAGGGLGMAHGNAETFPRLADVVGFIPPEHLVEIARAVVTVHRDFGDRTNRKHARLKYVLAERGVDWFRTEVEIRAGCAIAPARPFAFVGQGDLFGWHGQADGREFLGLYVESGRIKDTPDKALKTALRAVVARYGPEVRLTASQNLLLANLPSADRAGVTALLAEHGVPVERQASALRRAALACPALPTCGLALTEGERALPGLLTRLESMLAGLGLGEEEISVRLTGCPNGCARPYLAEIGIVGRAPGKYNLYLGGNATGTRLARVFRESVRLEDLERELRPILERFATERRTGERFGDFCERAVRSEPAAATR